MGHVLCQALGHSRERGRAGLSMEEGDEKSQQPGDVRDAFLAEGTARTNAPRQERPGVSREQKGQ